MSPHLFLLIGLPGSGKSSLARELVRQCPKRRIISTDRIRAQLFGDESVQGPWLEVQRMVDRQMHQTVQQILRGEVSEAIYDATNVVRRQRRRAIDQVRGCGFTHITGVWMKTPLWLCLSRNRHRDRRVPEEVILHMHQRLSGAPPSVADGFDRLVILHPGYLLSTRLLSG